MEALDERIARARTQTWHGSHGRGKDSKRVTLVVTPQERMVLLTALRMAVAIKERYRAADSYLGHRKGAATAGEVRVTARRADAATRLCLEYLTEPPRGEGGEG